MNRTIGVVAIALLVVCSSTVLKSQAFIMLVAGDKIASENFEGGVIGGVSMSSFSDEDTARFYVSWSIGALLQWKLGEHWIFSPEVTFKMPAGSRGMSGLWVTDPEFDTALSNVEQWTELSYVSIPLLIKYSISNFSINLGPQIGYIVAATDNMSGTAPEGGIVNVEKSAFSRINRWDLGIAVGMDVLLEPKDPLRSLRFGVRYYKGFLDVTTDDVSSTNSSFLFTVGVPIGGGKKEEIEK